MTTIHTQQYKSLHTNNNNGELTGITTTNNIFYYLETSANIWSRFFVWNSPWNIGSIDSVWRLGGMSSQKAKTVLSLDAEAVGSLREGVNFKKNPDDHKCYIIYKGENGFKACKNQCKHQGGTFIKDIEDLDGRWECSDRSTADQMQRDCSVMISLFPPTGRSNVPNIIGSWIRQQCNM